MSKIPVNRSRPSYPSVNIKYIQLAPILNLNMVIFQIFFNSSCELIEKLLYNYTNHRYQIIICNTYKITSHHVSTNINYY